MEDFAEYLPAALSLRRALVSITSLFPAESFEKLHEAVYKTFPGEELPRHETNRKLWNSIVSAEVKRLMSGQETAEQRGKHPKHNCLCAYLRLQRTCGLLVVVQRYRSGLA